MTSKQINVCQVEGCNKPITCKGCCHLHYLRFRRYGRYYRIHKEWKGKPRKYGYKSIKYMHKARFGGLRDEVMKRDGYKCGECGMTREEHKNRWGRDLTINHINGEGRYSDAPDNSINNLEVLCLQCHGWKDYNLSANTVIEGGVKTYE